MPAVRTWLGAGVLAAGMGVAVVGAAGVAQADTGGHSATGSAANKTDAGPSVGTKRAAAASGKTTGASATAAARLSRAAVKPAPISSATAKPAAASPAAILPPLTITRSGGASVNTPIGPISVSVGATLPVPFTDGPLAISLKATTPFGNGQGSLTGSQSVTPGLPPINTLTLNQGTLVLPKQTAFLVSAMGPAVVGGNSLSLSARTFAAAAQRGDVIGALTAVLSAAPNFANAVMFGRGTYTLPLISSINDDAQSVELHVPVGGWFAPLAPASVSFTDFTYVDESGLTYKVNGGEIEFTGTKFGGAVPAFFAMFG
ncbi:hypothetical protein [Mycobacterium sp. RTGN5]|uniref:hypothetical protein n=1 Tax=Mycobacterium sp. RTGN5 TaxID=3016522 RepID=UPI0029C96802|nr:hypothetical protein [Mycobacterium sp. RTGN5]